jgi:hypothetical protein
VTEEAKVVIDLKEGIIELQGPVEFVRHYLEIYQPSIRGLQIAPQKVAAGPEKSKRSPRRRSTKPAKTAKAKRVSCMAAIRNDLEAGFFDEPRSTGDVKKHLKEAGFEFSDGNVRNSLKRLTNTGALNANGKGGTLTYSRTGLS